MEDSRNAFERPIAKRLLQHSALNFDIILQQITFRRYCYKMIHIQK